jgi:fucose 4-O-acetylase-like acetyltransferase
MPAFIFISGYFAKGYITKDRQVKTQKLVTYIIYYLFAQLTVSLFEYYVLGHVNMSKSVFSARSSLWYLMCLIWWFMLLPYITRLKTPVIIGCAFLFGLLIGYDTDVGNFLSLTRAVNHFPFFIIGFYFKKEWLFKFRNIWTQLASVVILVLTTIWTFHNLDIIPSRIITSNYNYENSQLKYFIRAPFMNRLIYYIVAFVLVFCVLLLIPRGKAFYSRFGSRTLQVYILHRFLYLAELEYEWWNHSIFEGRKGAFLMALIAIAITFILSLKPFEIPFKLLGKIKIAPLEKPELRKE